MAAESPALALACDIADAIRHEGGRALVVGGFVRDRLLGHASKDLDLEVFGVPEEGLAGVLARFGRVEPVGQSFPVYKVGAIDVALPRRESKTGRGHKGFTVTGDPDMTFDEAARRRDFTINAIGWDPLTNEYLDPPVVATISIAACFASSIRETFGDDSLRVLRALQFAARFDLTLDPATFELCRTIPLDDLPAERIWGEIEKLLCRRAQAVDWPRARARPWRRRRAVCRSCGRWSAATRTCSGTRRATSGSTR